MGLTPKTTLLAKLKKLSYDDNCRGNPGFGGITMDDCIELKAGIKQLLDYEAVLICFEHIQHKVKLADLFEQAKAEAFQAGRKAGLGEAREAVWNLEWEEPDYYTGQNMKNVWSMAIDAIEALAGGGGR